MSELSISPAAEARTVNGSVKGDAKIVVPRAFAGGSGAGAARSERGPARGERPDWGERPVPNWERVRHGFSHRMRSAHTWILQESSFEEFLRDAKLDCKLRVEVTLGGNPLHCLDVRDAGRSARENGELLVVDNTLASSFGCAATRLGAHVAVEVMDRVLQREGSGLAAVSISKDARVPDALIRHQLDRLPTATHEQADELYDAMTTYDARRRAANDNAQVVAFYLACHPTVAEVSYPGMPHDPSFDVASRVLTNGFGPCVDFSLAKASEQTVRAVLDASQREFGAFVPGGTTSKLEQPIAGSEQRQRLRLTCGGGDPHELVAKLERLLNLV